MRAKLDLTLAVHSYDRTLPILDGRVQVEGCNLIALPLLPEETFNRAFVNHEFDVCELSMCTYLHSRDHGQSHYIAIPAFVSRVFRHNTIFIRTDRGITRPEDLRGRTIGVPEYQMTAGLWVRGMLSDVYGVDARDVHWRTGGLEDPGRTEKFALRLPDGFDVRPIPAERTLSDMLAEGDLDALIGPRLPSCFARGAPNVARLFPDFREAEKDYFRQTGLFPIMHTIGIRAELVERHPWIAASVFKAFSKAKSMVTANLDELGASEVTLPWVAAEVMATRELMGEDFWPYGVEQNRAALEAMVRYAHEQGLISERPAIESLFARGSQIEVKI